MNWWHVLVSFDGRVGRGAFWRVFAAIVFVWVCTGIVSAGLLSGRAGVIVPYVVFAAIAYGYLAAAVKRLHDRGRTGWWLLPVYGPGLAVAAAVELLGLDPTTSGLQIAFGLAVLPTVWAFIELFLMPGTPGPNDYGPERAL